MHRKLDFEQIEVGDIIRAEKKNAVFHIKVDNVELECIRGIYKAKMRSDPKMVLFPRGRFDKDDYKFFQLNKSYL